jgi:hypothetical protein
MILEPQAVIDDSGSEPQSRIFVLAGFAASANAWANFAVDWRAALDEPPKLEYFKMTEAANFGGQFARDKGWDEAKRDDRLISLTRIINKHACLLIHAAVRNDHFEKYIKSIPAPERTLAIDSPYVLMFTQIILAMATGGDQVGIRDACDFIFDEQGAFSKEALAFWPKLKALLDISPRSDLGKFVGSPPIFRDDKTFLPLQAADLYAWQIRQHFSRNQILIMPPSRILRQFENLPAISRVYDEPELKRLRDQLLKGGEIFAANNPTIPLVHAGKTKSERKRVRKQTKGTLSGAVWSTMKPREPSGDV